jgi:hypothetical protein
VRALSAGDKLGLYEILAPSGAGGMQDIQDTLHIPAGI